MLTYIKFNVTWVSNKSNYKWKQVLCYRMKGYTLVKRNNGYNTTDTLNPCDSNKGLMYRAINWDLLVSFTLDINVMANINRSNVDWRVNCRDTTKWTDVYSYIAEIKNGQTNTLQRDNRWDRREHCIVTLALVLQYGIEISTGKTKDIIFFMTKLFLIQFITNMNYYTPPPPHHNHHTTPLKGGPWRV